MALVGRWNWYLPAWAGRALRVRPWPDRVAQGVASLPASSTPVAARA